MQTKKMVLATSNEGKVKEIQHFLKGLPVEIQSLKQWDNVPEVEEDKDTFAANALKKARVISLFCGEITLADDSSLEVEALEGLPGVRSARFAGSNASDEENNHLLLEKLKSVPSSQRDARFVCVLALFSPDGAYRIIEGTCEGKILFAPKGDGGFGYDPLFFHEPTGLTFAQMEADVKNKVSHRGKALQKLRAVISEFI